MGVSYPQFSASLRALTATVPISSYFTTVLALCLVPILALILYGSEKSRAQVQLPKGYKKLGLRTRSNLNDEFDEAYSNAESVEGMSTNDWKLKSIWVYPVKSCRGVELEQGSVIAAGMKYDRLFTFAQLRSPFPVAVETPEEEKAAHKWEFITQRQFPRLAQIRTDIWIPDVPVNVHGLSPGAEHNRGVVIVSYPHQERGWRGLLSKLVAALSGGVPEKHWKIPLDPTPSQIQAAGYTLEPVKIWKETITALNMESEIPQELRRFIGTSNKLGLFRIDETKLREVYRNAPTKEQLGYQPVTGFQDAYPLHLLNIASVRHVEAQIPESAEFQRLSVDRFRANLIISGPGRYQEDDWRRIKIGDFEFDISCRTARCKMPNVDQESGNRHLSEPDRTLRKARAIDVGAGSNIGCLGVQMVPISQHSMVRVGDKVEVLATGEHCYIMQ